MNSAWLWCVAVVLVCLFVFVLLCLFVVVVVWGFLFGCFGFFCFVVGLGFLVFFVCMCVFSLILLVFPKFIMIKETMKIKDMFSSLEVHPALGLFFLNQYRMGMPIVLLGLLQRWAGSPKYLADGVEGSARLSS